MKDQLFQIVNTLIRVSPEAKSRVLDWFAAIMDLNIKRTAIQVRCAESLSQFCCSITPQIDPGTVASDGFMLNVTSVLTRLCEPFMDTAYSKARVSQNLFSRHLY